MCYTQYMRRTIVNLSLPPEIKEEADVAVKSGRFATRSEFFRNLMRLWREEEALRELREGQVEIVRGKAKRLGSLKDLR